MKTDQEKLLKTLQEIGEIAEPRPDLVIPCAGCGQPGTVEPGTGSIPLCGVCSDLFDGVHGGEKLLVMFDKETAKEIEIGGVQ
jgi:hypothetical protein